MNHKKFDSQIKGAFDEMDDYDIEQAMHNKEKIWDSLDVNRKKANWRNGLIWFFLGLLLALGSLYLKQIFLDAPKHPDHLIAQMELSKDWEVQMKRMESKMAEMEFKYDEKNDLIDSLTGYNMKLQEELLAMASIETSTNLSKEKVLLVQDTIYLTQVEKEVVELEKIVRDTVFIEVPILLEEEDLMTDISNNLDVKKDKNSIKPDNALVKSKPTSVQFNFRKGKSENK